MSKKLGGIIGFLVIALIVVYIAFQIYMVAYPSYKTQAAVASRVSSSLDVKGVVMRDETVIDASANGIKNYLVSDGEKIANGANVAEVYLSNESAAKRLRLSLLEEELSLLTNFSDSGRTAGTNIETLSSRINSELSNYSLLLAEDDYSSLHDTRLSSLRLLNSFTVAAGNSVDLETRIAELRAEIDTINTTNTEPSGYISTSLDGYFVSLSDGLEETLNKDYADSVSITELREILKQKAEPNFDACKIISDYHWFFVFETNEKYAKQFENVQKVNLTFSYSAAGKIPAKVVSCTADEETNAYKVVLKCDYLGAELARLRIAEAAVEFEDYEGIKVERSALRIENGEVGVYVKFGSAVTFKKVDIVYETEDFILSKVNSTDDDYLELYDEIFIEGKDLYVGKELAKA